MRLVLISICLFVLACKTPQTPAPKPEKVQPAASAKAESAPAATATDYARFEKMESPETLAWVRQRHGEARQALDALPSRKRFHDGVSKYIDTPSISMPVQTRSHFFYTRRKPGIDHPLLVRTKRVGHDEEVVLDPNTWSKDGKKSLYAWRLSHNERFLAYGITTGGSDWRSWRILDLRTLKRLDDELRGQKWSSPAWAPDDKGLFYSGYADRTHQEVCQGHGQPRLLPRDRHPTRQ